MAIIDEIHASGVHLAAEMPRNLRDGPDGVAPGVEERQPRELAPIAMRLGIANGAVGGNNQASRVNPLSGRPTARNEAK